ncbi:hypothetical protein PINS_up006827 [Pythium insidiosum]|nr:hypothetical protein PINS_up006827 [Pythium insidiosum]
MAFCVHWSALFPRADGGEDPRATDGAKAASLGINYVVASASTTDVGGVCVRQDLRRFGVAGTVWNCARVLVEFFAQHPTMLSKRRVIELGAGTGAVGLAVARVPGVASVALTDLSNVIFALTAKNAAAAAAQHDELRALSMKGALSAKPLRWGDEVSEDLRSVGPWDVVLCSDCLYEPQSYPDLLSSLDALAATTTIVYIAYKQRHPDRERSFFESASKRFEIEVWSEQADDARPTAFRDEEIFVCRLQRRSDDGSGPAT